MSRRVTKLPRGYQLPGLPAAFLLPGGAPRRNAGWGRKLLAAMVNVLSWVLPLFPVEPVKSTRYPKGTRGCVAMLLLVITPC